MPPTAPQPIVSLPKHPHFPLPGVMRPPSPRNVPLTRSSGLHPDDTGPKAKLRFPSTGMKIPPPMQIAPTPKRHAPVPIQSASVPKAKASVTPVVTLPGQGVRTRVSLLIQTWSLRMNQEVLRMILLLFQVFQ